MSRRKIFLSFDFILLVVLATILLAHYFGVISGQTDKFTLLAVATIAILPVAVNSVRALKNKKLSIDLLAAIALIVSLVAKEWTSAVFINLMLTSARLFARYTENRAKQAIKSLLKLKPSIAKIKQNKEIKEVPLSQLKIGDLVVVELGERIPVDGVINQGQASIDQSSLTGESIPVAKKQGDKVLSSTIVVDGNLIIEAEKIGSETTLEKIIDLVEKSQINKAPIQTLSQKFTSWYIAISIIGALALYLASTNISLVLSVLLVTCADDIAVAIPLAFMAAMGYAAKKGVIIKGGNFIEGLTNLKILLVDKTGTLTLGKLKLQDFFLFAGADRTKALEAAGAISFFSSHPSAKAILQYVKKSNINFGQPENFKEYPGKGASAIYGQQTLFSGKLSFFKEQKVPVSQEQEEKINAEKQKGLNVTLFGTQNSLIGLFALGDELRPKIKETLEEIRKSGIKKIVMLTGDNEKIAKHVAQQSGIDEFHANLMPEEKLIYIKKYLNKKYKIAMIGDGVNDAAALSLADIGIAMGTIGSDVAIETADIALMKDDISRLPEIIRVSKYAVRVARQNFWIWGIVNFIGLSLVFGGFILPAGAAAYNFITDFIPLINSIKLFRLHLERPPKA